MHEAKRGCRNDDVRVGGEAGVMVMHRNARINVTANLRYPRRITSNEGVRLDEFYVRLVM